MFVTLNILMKGNGCRTSMENVYEQYTFQSKFKYLQSFCFILIFLCRGKDRKLRLIIRMNVLSKSD